MNSAREPVLGLEADASSDTPYLHLLAPSRVALCFAVAGLVLMVAFVVLGFYLYPTADQGISVLLGSLPLLSFCCWLLGLGFGTYTRRARRGKIALLLSLLAMVLGPIAWIVFAEMDNVRKGIHP